MQDDWDNIVAIVADSGASLEAAAEAIAAGDPLAAEVALSEAGDGVNRTYGLIALAARRCGAATPERTAAAALNIPTEGNAAQIAAGFGSIWVSEVMPAASCASIRRRVRSSRRSTSAPDRSSCNRPTVACGCARRPNTSRSIPRRTRRAHAWRSPRSGRPSNRNWVVDGAMWICDGQRLHRYDPNTLQPVTTIELGIDCGQPYATDELVGRLDLQRRRRRVGHLRRGARGSRDEHRRAADPAPGRRVCSGRARRRRVLPRESRDGPPSSSTAQPQR